MFRPHSNDNLIPSFSVFHFSLSRFKTLCKSKRRGLFRFYLLSKCCAATWSAFGDLTSTLRKAYRILENWPDLIWQSETQVIIIIDYVSWGFLKTYEAVIKIFWRHWAVLSFLCLNLHNMTHVMSTTCCKKKWLHEGQTKKFWIPILLELHMIIYLDTVIKLYCRRSKTFASQNCLESSTSWTQKSDL